MGALVDLGRQVLGRPGEVQLALVCLGHHRREGEGQAPCRHWQRDGLPRSVDAQVYATKESKGKGVAYPPAVQSIVNAIGELSGDYDADLNRLLSAHNQYLTMYSEVSDVKSFTEIVAPVGAHLAANMASNQSRKATSLSPLAAMTSEIVLHRGGIDNLKRMNAYGKDLPQSLKAAAISDTNAVVSPSQYVNNGVAPAVLSAYIGYLGN